MVNAKKKGNGYENEIAKRLAAMFGWNAKRNLVQCRIGGGKGEPDIIGCDPFHIECKNCKTLSVFKWWRQLLNECGKNLPALIFHIPRDETGGRLADDVFVCRLNDLPTVARELVEAMERNGERTPF